MSKLLLLGFLFLVLLGLYLKFYFIGEAKEYGKGATTFSSVFQHREKFDMPTVVFCMRPSVLPSMTEKYDYQQFFEIKYEEELRESNQSVWEIAEKISYKLNRDYIVQLRGDAFDDIQRGILRTFLQHSSTRLLTFVLQKTQLFERDDSSVI